MDLEPITAIFDYDEISTPFRLNATIENDLVIVSRKTYLYRISPVTRNRLFDYLFTFNVICRIHMLYKCYTIHLTYIAL